MEHTHYIIKGRIFLSLITIRRKLLKEFKEIEVIEQTVKCCTIKINNTIFTTDAKELSLTSIILKSHKDKLLYARCLRKAYVILILKRNQNENFQKLL